MGTEPTAVFDVADFQADVIEKSFERPVLVDFWAAWCGPCRVLGPTLESLAHRSGGRWLLRKVNTEQFPDVAARYGIQSIPNVKLFEKGEVVDEFVGALPEAAILQWLEKALPDPDMERLDHAEALLRSGQREAAYAGASDVLRHAPENERARAIAASAILFSDPVRAGDLVADMDEGNKHWEQAGSVRELAALLTRSLSTASFEEKPVRDTYVKAIRHLKEGAFDAALEAFIAVIREDRYYDDDGSRKACIAIFKYLGEDHEITKKHRRDFGSALYV